MIYTNSLAKSLFISDNNSEDKTKVKFSASTTSSNNNTSLFSIKKILLLQRAVKKFLYSSKRLQIKRYREELQVKLQKLNF